MIFFGPEAPRYARDNDDFAGFPSRTLNTLLVYVLRKMGHSIKSATGVAPQIIEKYKTYSLTGVIR